MPLQNVYYERKIGTERPCYVCNRPTTTVLATIKAEDFIYTCESHLSDPGFVTPIAPTGPTQEDIRKVISDYSARERTKEKVEDKDKDDKKDEKKEESKGVVSSLISSLTGKDEKKDKEAESPSKPASPAPITTGIPSVPAQTHKKYALHRHFFENRKAELGRKQATARAKEVSKGLPQVPRGF